MKKRTKRLRTASKTPAYIRDIASSKWTREQATRHANRKLGTFGAASEVRRIDPTETGGQ